MKTNLTQCFVVFSVLSAFVMNCGVIESSENIDDINVHQQAIGYYDVFADLNEDGSLTCDDPQVWIDNNGWLEGEEGYDPRADVNNDGFVNVIDAFLLIPYLQAAKMDCQNPPVCGDGLLQSGEQCDTGEAISNSCAYGEENCQVCNDSCQVVRGLSSYCGDGVQNGNEECDDGNVITESCSYGQKWCTVCNDKCEYQGGLVKRCGDNKIDQGEQCDNGSNNKSTCEYGETSCEVCTPACRIKNGKTSYCGDQILDEEETCDGADCLPDCSACDQGFELNDKGDCVPVYVPNCEDKQCGVGGRGAKGPKHLHIYKDLFTRTRNGGNEKNIERLFDFRDSIQKR